MNRNILYRNVQAGPNEQGHTYTIEDAVEQLGFGKFQFNLSILTGMAWMADAMELMILSIIAPALRLVPSGGAPEKCKPLVKMRMEAIHG